MIRSRTWSSRLAAAAVAALLGMGTAHAQDAQAFGSEELVEAASKEGRLTLYTANWADDEQDLIQAFNKRYPKIAVQVVRLPGGQLVARVQSEAAAGKLGADVIDFSDRKLAATLKDLFADYRPANAQDYRTDSLVADNLWPRTVWGWGIAYNTALTRKPPTGWAELAENTHGTRLGHTIPAAGGAPWTAVLFERKVLGEGYWEKLAAQNPLVTPSSPQLSSALIRGEVGIAPLLTNGVVPNARDGAPVKLVLPPEGIPITPSAAGVTKTAAHPNAARLFLNWSLSEEGQRHWIEQRGGFSALKNAPLPAGITDKIALWLPSEQDFEQLREPWTREWNKTFRYGQ